MPLATSRCFSLCLLFFSLLIPKILSSQTNGSLRGNVVDQSDGTPVAFAAVQIADVNKGTTTDLDGFFALSELAPGEYQLGVSFLGYRDTSLIVTINPGQISYLRIPLSSGAIDLETLDLSARNQQAKTNVQLATIQVNPSEIKAMPSTGGEADLAQYLSVLPGIVTTGDQGGQLYIRGGAPVQNKVLLDGMTIYNPFHSIGFFSVFETETIQNVDVLTAGFNAEHGGRISAIVDITTREGNKKRHSGLVSASPFQAKALIEGPFIPYNEETGTGASFIFTGKHSYLDQTSRQLYAYAIDTSFYSFTERGDTASLSARDIGLPYQFTDLYGKLSFNAGNGSRLDLFGFRHSDVFDFAGLVNLNWDAFGLGANFKIVPTNSDIIINGALSYSDYLIALQESDGFPRTSGINSINAQLSFDYFGDARSVHYGFEFTSFNTDFQFRNSFGNQLQQRDFTTELAGFVKYRQQIGGLIMEPGLRLHYYASQARMSIEPRLGLKYNISEDWRFKMGAGRYAQNVLSTRNDLDVVNFFAGYLAGPEETIFDPETNQAITNRLQQAWHAVAGLEWDASGNLQLGMEAYYKNFSQLIRINRNKIDPRDPDFSIETGEAYGLDFTARYQRSDWYLWLTYSLAHVTRDDGRQVYPTVFDRRHNINFLLSYQFGPQDQWEAGARWNFGSPFPFTQTQGFYQDVNFQDLLQTDVLQGNFPIGTLLAEDINGGRLAPYHRLDLSLKYTLSLGEYSELETNLSVTNAYDRANVFYVDRLTNARVDQLPILPSIGLTFRF
ncbi:MAG TPA: TonB-dependent receptor [Saprospiraceae bacterium]|nr:TonB-dependent receptor [Saprospiraceae bacterium]